MNATLTALTVATFLFLSDGAEDEIAITPMVVEAESGTSASPYIEITQLSPAAAPRIIHAVPRAEVRENSMLLPASAHVTLQPVEPAATRPYIVPSPTLPPPVPSAYPQITYGPAAAPQVVYRQTVPLGGVTLGRGVIGQPKLYVEGQPVRNFIRWLSP